MQFKDTVRAYQPDAIGAAAAKLSNASYPFIKAVPWNSGEFLLTPGTPDPIGWAGAIGKIIDMGASMDGELVKAGCMAHHAAIKDLPADGVCSPAQMTEIYAAIGRMIASVPESTVMGVYSAMGRIAGSGSGIPMNLFQKQNRTDAMAAYSSLMQFKDTVRAAQPSQGQSRPSMENDGLLSVLTGLGGLVLILPALGNLLPQ